MVEETCPLYAFTTRRQCHFSAVSLESHTSLILRDICASSTAADVLGKSYALTKRVQVLLTERWASLERRVCFNSMHPGWVDTPGLKVGMPNFREKQKDSLRSVEQGADTIVWLVRAASITL